MSTTISASLAPSASTTPPPVRRWPLPGAADSAASQLRLLLSTQSPDAPCCLPDLARSGGLGGSFEVGGPSVAGKQSLCSASSHSTSAPAYPGRLLSMAYVPPASTITTLRCVPSPPRLLSTVHVPASSTINALRVAPPLPPAVDAVRDSRDEAARDSPDWHTVVSRRRRRAPPVLSSTATSNGRLRSHAKRLLAEQRRAAYLRRFCGKCLRCLAPGHRASQCRDPVRCSACWRWGHRSRSSRCPARKPPSPPPCPPPPPPPPPCPPPPPPPVPPRHPPLAAPPPPARAAINPRRSPAAMAYRLGDPSRRPAPGATFSVCSQAIEDAARHLRGTAVVVTLSEPRQDINPQLVAKAIEHDLAIPWDQMHVSRHHPEDFLIRFAQPRHQTVAVDAGVATCRGIALSIAPWRPAAGGNKRAWRFYCRIALENLPVQAWRREVVQDVVGLACWVDRLERQTSSLSNTAAAYAWVWAWSPDDIPLGSGHSFLDRAPDGRSALPEGTPWEEALHGPQFPVIIHLDTIKDYTPSPIVRPGPATSGHSWSTSPGRVSSRTGRWRLRRADDLVRITHALARGLGATMMKTTMWVTVDGSAGTGHVPPGVAASWAAVRTALFAALPSVGAVSMAPPPVMDVITL
ncbi:hypothetical protein VPH35_005980 [Triticum aestivum]